MSGIVNARDTVDTETSAPFATSWIVTAMLLRSPG
jgi:hypothetical protein